MGPGMLSSWQSETAYRSEPRQCLGLGRKGGGASRLRSKLTAPVIAQPMDQTAVPQTPPNVSRHIPTNNNGWSQTQSPIKEASVHHTASNNNGCGDTPSPTKEESVHSNNNCWNQVSSPTQSSKGKGKKPVWNSDGPGKPEPRAQKQYWGDDNNDE